MGLLKKLTKKTPWKWDDRLYERATQKTRTYFAPTQKVRVRDFVREVPHATRTVLRGIATGTAGRDASRAAARIGYLRPVAGKVRVRDVVRELPTGIHETLKNIPQQTTRFAISAYEAPKALQTGRATGKWYNTPFGRVNSFQSEAQNRVRRGESAAKAIGHGILDVALGAGDFGAAAKPLLAAAKRAPVKEVRNIAHDFTQPLTQRKRVTVRRTRRTEVVPGIYAPGGVPQRRMLHTPVVERTTKTVTQPTPFRSAFMQSLSRPGLTVTSVNGPTNKNTQHINAWKQKSQQDALKKVAAMPRGAAGVKKQQRLTEQILPEVAMKKGYKNAYKVYSGDKKQAKVAQLLPEVAKKTRLPQDIIVKRAFFEKMARKHPEIDRRKLFEFVKTLHIPDNIQQLPEAERLNFLRKLENSVRTNVVGTVKNSSVDNAITTSFLTKSKVYPENIKKTSKEVFSKDVTGGALRSSSLPSRKMAPPAGARPSSGLSGVSDSTGSIPLLPAPRKSTLKEPPLNRLMGKEVIITPPPTRQMRPAKTTPEAFARQLDEEIKVGEVSTVKKFGETARAKDYRKDKLSGGIDFEPAGQITPLNYSDYLYKLGFGKKKINEIGYEKGKEIILRKMPQLRIIEEWRKEKKEGNVLLDEKAKGFSKMADDILRNARDYTAAKATAFNELFKRWIGARNAVATTGYEAGKAFQHVAPGKDTMEIIDFIEGENDTISDDLLPVAERFKEFMKILYEKAKNSGLKMNELQNYVPHIWQEGPEEVAKKFAAYKRLNPGFKFAKKRYIPTYREGIKMGLHPKYDDLGSIAAEYATRLERAIADRQFINQLKDMKVIVPQYIGRNAGDFSAVNSPGFLKTRWIKELPARYKGEKPTITIEEGDFYAPAEIAHKLNRVFGQEGYKTFGRRAMEHVAKASSRIQDVTMSGGLPKTPLNAFSFAQLTKEVLAGRLRKPIAAIFRSISRNRSREYFERNVAAVREMQKNNIPISTTLDTETLMSNIFGKKRAMPWLTRIADKWDAVMNEPTFKRFMPMLQVELYKDIKAKALYKGLSEREAQRVASDAVANFYGFVRTDRDAVRSPATKDAITTVFFAPRYRRAMINFWLKNIGAFVPAKVVSVGNKRHLVPTNPFTLENQTNLRFAVGALATYAAYDYLNYYFNGRHLWQNPDGKKDKLLIPGTDYTIGIPYLSSIATMPRLAMRIVSSVRNGDISDAAKDFMATTTSVGLSPFADILRNQDYWGRAIVDKYDAPSEKMKKYSTHIAKRWMHPYIRGAMEFAQGTPRGQVASIFLEAPLRFYKTGSVQAAQFWNTLEKADAMKKKYNALLRENPEYARTFYDKHRDLIDYSSDLHSIKSRYYQMRENGIDKKEAQSFLGESLYRLGLGQAPIMPKEEGHGLTEYVKSLGFGGSKQENVGISPTEPRGGDAGDDTYWMNRSGAFRFMPDAEPRDPWERATWQEKRRDFVSSLLFSDDYKYIPAKKRKEIAKKLGYGDTDIKILHIKRFKSNAQKAPFVWKTIEAAKDSNQRIAIIDQLVENGLLSTHMVKEMDKQGLLSDVDYSVLYDAAKNHGMRGGKLRGTSRGRRGRKKGRKRTKAEIGTMSALEKYFANAITRPVRTGAHARTGRITMPSTRLSDEILRAATRSKRSVPRLHRESIRTTLRA